MQFTAHSCSEYAVNKILYYNNLTQLTAQLHTKTETFSEKKHQKKHQKNEKKYIGF